MHMFLLEETLKVFRDNIFGGISKIPQDIQKLLEDSEHSNYQNQALINAYSGDTSALSGDIYSSMQITLEFLDKGLKGFLTGDVSAFAVK